MDRERLAAFVDGALAPEDAAAVVMHLADHPQDQAHVDDLIAANELLAEAYAGPLHEPVPPAIHAAIMGEQPVAPVPDPASGAAVLPFRARRGATVWLGAVLALAASVAAVAVLMTGPSVPASDRLLALGPVAPTSDLGRIIGDLPSLTPDTLDGGLEVMVLASLRTADGRFCREIEAIDPDAARLETAIACTTPEGGWRVEIAVQEALRDDEAGFVTASGSGAGLLGQFLDRQGAGLTLDPEAEAQAIRSGWTR